MIPTKIYTFVVPAGGSFQLTAIGAYFKILTATGALEVRGDTFGTIGQVRPGQGLRGTPFGRLELRDVSGGDNKVSVLVSGESFVDERISGSVEVVDGGKDRSYSGRAFIGGETAQPLAANNSFLQLWNPPGSAKNVILESMFLWSAAASLVLFRYGSVPLGAASTNASAKDLGGAVSAAEVRFGQFPAMTGTGMFAFPLQAGVGAVPPLKEPIVIRPGVGFTCANNMQNTILSAVFELYEESVI